MHWAPERDSSQNNIIILSFFNVHLTMNPLATRELIVAFVHKTESKVTSINFSRCIFILDEQFNVREKQFLLYNSLTSLVQVKQ